MSARSEKIVKTKLFGGAISKSKTTNEPWDKDVEMAKLKIEMEKIELEKLKVKENAKLKELQIKYDSLKKKMVDLTKKTEFNTVGESDNSFGYKTL